MKEIRIADVKDARNLASFARETFVETFSGLNTEEDMECYCSDSFGEEKQLEEIKDPSKCTVLYEIDGVLAGYGQINWNSIYEKIDSESQAEIQRIYVKNSWHGKGIGHELMEFLLNLIKDRGIENIWLGVWEKNPKAIAFYKKYDFWQIGEHNFLLGSDRQRDVIFCRDLSL